MARRLGPAKPLGVTWKGAGAWLIFSQSRQVNFSRTCWITFHCRGITSSVSVMSSPSFASRVPPQQAQEVGTEHDHPLPRQMLGKRLARGTRAAEGRDMARLGRGLLGGELILARRALELLELQLQLVEKTRRPLRARPVDLALELLDRKLQMRDQSPVVRRLGLGAGRIRLSDDPSVALGDQRRLQGLDIVWKIMKASAHDQNQSIKRSACEAPSCGLIQ